MCFSKRPAEWSDFLWNDFKTEGTASPSRDLAAGGHGVVSARATRLSSPSHLDILIRELFWAAEPGMAIALANGRVGLNVTAKPLTHDPGDAGWCVSVPSPFQTRAG